MIAIIPTADRQKATVKVRVGFEKLESRILPDMSVKVAFQNSAEGRMQNAESGILKVPKSAVRQRDGRDIVWLVRDRRAERRAVTLGAAQGDDVTIATGISGGDRLIIEGADNLVDGARVTEAKQ